MISCDSRRIGPVQTHTSTLKRSPGSSLSKVVYLRCQVTARWLPSDPCPRRQSEDCLEPGCPKSNYKLQRDWFQQLEVTTSKSFAFTHVVKSRQLVLHPYSHRSIWFNIKFNLWSEQVELLISMLKSRFNGLAMEARAVQHTNYI